MDLLVAPAFVVAPRALLGVRLVEAPACATLASAAVVAACARGAGPRKLRRAVAGLVLGTPAFYVAAVLAGAPFGGGAGDNAAVAGADALHSLGTLAWAALAAAVVGADRCEPRRRLRRLAPRDPARRAGDGPGAARGLERIVGVLGAWVSAALRAP